MPRRTIEHFIWYIGHEAIMLRVCGINGVVVTWVVQAIITSSSHLLSTRGGFDSPLMH